MGDFSRNTFNKLNHYVSVRMQQGVPLIDADWNEQEDIRKYELRTFLKWFIGNGVPKGNNGFKIMPPENNEENDFIIKGGTTNEPGYCLVDGWDVLIDDDINYTGQLLYKNEDLPTKWNVKKLESLSPLSVEQTERKDLVFLDVWEREVDAYEDEELINQDIGIETCVRLKREWVVRVAENLSDLGNIEEHLKSEYLKENLIFPLDHVYYPLAWLKRIVDPIDISKEDIDIEDLRRTVTTIGDGPPESTQPAEPITVGTVDGDLSVSGNVGFGTSTPTAKLDVRGDIVTSGKISSQNSREIASFNDKIECFGCKEYVDMPGMTIDISTGNNILLVLFKAGGLYLENLEGSLLSPAFFRLVVDDQEVCSTVHHVDKDSWDIRDVTLHWMDGVEPGDHTIKVQWSQPEGKMITCCMNDVTRSLIAVEL